MSKTIPAFEEIEVISQNGLAKVVLEFIGEGFSEDYDPNDPDDKPLIRFSLYRKDDGDPRLEGNWDFSSCNNDWLSVNDGSYCTLLSVNDDRDKLVKAANVILQEVESGLTDCQRQKRLYEYLSYISVETLEAP